MVENFPSRPRSSLKKPSLYTKRACWKSERRRSGKGEASGGQRGLAARLLLLESPHEAPLLKHTRTSLFLRMHQEKGGGADRRQATIRAAQGREQGEAPPPESWGQPSRTDPGRHGYTARPDTPEQTCCRQGSPSQISWKRPSRKGSRRRRASATTATATTMMPGSRGRPCSGACRRCPACRRRCCPA